MLHTPNQSLFHTEDLSLPMLSNPVPISPVNPKEQVSLVGRISVSEVISLYQSLKIDVSSFFNGLDEIKIYQGQQSGFSFFYPDHLAGDSGFYEQLQAFDWYYDPWKWEHEQASQFCNARMKVLEVGCGQGSFLAELTRRLHIHAVGLELNHAAQREGVAAGIDICLESVVEHADAHPNHYDLVCSFQVLEHISSVRSFLEGQIACLKPGGLLINCVPNNDSFIKHAENNPMNMPPHHMGLWTEQSLRKLPDFFPVDLVSIIYEPLQRYHLEWFLNIFEQQRLKTKWQQFFYYRLKIRSFLAKVLWRFPKLVKGHSIMAVYRKK